MPTNYNAGFSDFSVNSQYTSPLERYDQIVMYRASGFRNGITRNAKPLRMKKFRILDQSGSHDQTVLLSSVYLRIGNEGPTFDAGTVAGSNSMLDQSEHYLLISANSEVETF